MTEQKKDDQQPLAATATVENTDCSRPGELLKTAREAKGISQEDVAKKLNFLPLYVRALEEEKFEPLHSVTFIKGYLRAYARFLEIDADEVLRCFAIHHPELVKQESHQPVEVMRPEKTTSSLVFKLFSVIVIIALIAIIIVWWQSRSAEPLPNVSNQEVQVDTLDGKTILAPVRIELEAVTPVQQVENEVKKAEQPIAAAEKAKLNSAVEGQQDKPLVAVKVAPVVQEKLQEKPQEKPVPVVAAVVAKPAPKVPSRAINGDPAATTQGNARLVALTFSNECWVEVRDATGRMLHAGLMQANDNVLLEGQPPFQAVFGNGTVAKVFYNGKAFDFSSSIRPNGYTSVKIQ